MNVSTETSGSTWTCERNPITLRPESSSTAALNFSRIVSWNALRVSCTGKAAGVDQRPLDRRVDVLEEADHVVGAHHRACSARPASEVLTMDAHDRV